MFFINIHIFSNAYATVIILSHTIGNRVLRESSKLIITIRLTCPMLNATLLVLNTIWSPQSVKLSSEADTGFSFLILAVYSRIEFFHRTVRRPAHN